MGIKLNQTQIWTILIYLLLFFSIFHLIRDLLQIGHASGLISTPLNTNKNWCNPYCDYVTLPPEIFVILGSILVLKRQQFGLLGKLVVIVFGVWSAIFWWSYFYH